LQGEACGFRFDLVLLKEVDALWKTLLFPAVSPALVGPALQHKAQAPDLAFLTGNFFLNDSFGDA